MTLSGCVTGERPTLAERPETTGDSAADAVLALLDQSRTATFTAGYDVLTRFGGLQTPAAVVQAAADRRSITVGNVRFLVDGAATATCFLDRAPAAPPSTPGGSATPSWRQLLGSSAAARLRRDVDARLDATTGSTQGHRRRDRHVRGDPGPDSEVDLLRAGQGVLARLDAADVVIEMTS